MGISRSTLREGAGVAKNAPAPPHQRSALSVCGVVAGHWGGRRSRSPGRPCAAGRLGHSATGIVYIRAKVAVRVGARLLALVNCSRFLNGFGIFGPRRFRQNCRHLQPFFFGRVARRQPFLEVPGARRSGRKYKGHSLFSDIFQSAFWASMSQYKRYGGVCVELWCQCDLCWHARPPALVRELLTLRNP